MASSCRACRNSFSKTSITRSAGWKSFDKLMGDEVKSAPQFQDNLASFGVAYGLAVQALGSGRTFHQPFTPGDRERPAGPAPRSRGPWRPRHLILLGLTSLFAFGDYRALAKVTTPQFKSAVEQANSVSKRGASIKRAFETAKNELARASSTRERH